MKTLFYLLVFLCLAPAATWAQGVGLGIGTPNSSAMLDVTSTSKGVLIPRMSTDQRGKIASPANGLMVYDTDSKGFWYYNGATWQAMGGAAGASKTRTIYVPARAMSYSGTDGITPNRWGITLTSTSSTEPSVVVPRPLDWDDSQPFSLTLYFSAPSISNSGVVSWRMGAGGNLTDRTTVSNGWDSLDYYTTEDGAPVTLLASGNYASISKSQTWTAKYSNTYKTWYFGTGNVTVANSFDNDTNPLWHFNFQRGRNLSGNPEGYNGDLTINGLLITYTTK